MAQETELFRKMFIPELGQFFNTVKRSLLLSQRHNILMVKYTRRVSQDTKRTGDL